MLLHTTAVVIVGKGLAVVVARDGLDRAIIATTVVPGSDLLASYLLLTQFLSNLIL